MSEEEKDENLSSDSSTEDNSPKEGDEQSPKGDSAKEEGEKTIPYSRFKEVNDKYKKAQEELEKSAKKVQFSPDDEVSKLVDVSRATRDLGDDEIEELQLRAKGKGVSLSKARDENFKTWLNAKREKVKKENSVPEPSSPVSTGSDFEIKPDMSEKEIDDMVIKKAQEAERKESSGI